MSTIREDTSQPAPGRQVPQGLRQVVEAGIVVAPASNGEARADSGTALVDLYGKVEDETWTAVLGPDTGVAAIEFPSLDEGERARFEARTGTLPAEACVVLEDRRVLVLMRHPGPGAPERVGLGGGARFLGSGAVQLPVEDGQAARWLGGSPPQVLPETPGWLSSLLHGRLKVLPVSEADFLVELVMDEINDLVYTPSREAYARVPVGGHEEALQIASGDFEHYVDRVYYQWTSGLTGTGRVASKKVLRDVAHHFGGMAKFEGDQVDVHVRLAHTEDAVVVDLGRDADTYLRIDSAGWELTRSSPVPFVRPPQMRPLPVPVHGGSMDDLRPFVNAPEESAFRLIVAWVLGFFIPSQVFPILLLQGEQGSAKTTTTQTLRSILDPVKAPLLTPPRCDRDLHIAAVRQRLLCFDNLSGLRLALADRLCRLATGSGFATRKLHTDLDEVVIDVSRPIIINGIDGLLGRSDLLDRSIVLFLPPIDETQRRSRSAMREDFDADAPGILGALFDAVAGALGRLDDVQGSLDRLPRMGDFAEWVTAAEPALGWADGTFVEEFQRNREQTTDLAIDGDIVATAVLTFMTNRPRPTWEGTPSRLYDVLRDVVGDAATARRGWPASASALGDRLRRASPGLRSRGIDLSFGMTGRDRDRHRVVRLRRL